MQRLFTNFANGWPGRGLFAQRVLIAVVLVREATAHLGASSGSSVFLELVGGGLGIFILVGLWTPPAAILVALAELGIAFFSPGDKQIPIMLAILGCSLAMIGPGAWSVDARLFGRKRILSPSK